MTMILAIDIESTGLDEKTCDVTEVGAILYDWEEATIYGQYSQTVILDGVLPEFIKQLTGMTDRMVQAPFAKPREVVASEFLRFTDHADYFMAHNAFFDFKFLDAMYTKCGRAFPSKPWIDTKADLPFPLGKGKSSALTYLCADHGFVNPFPHRALYDAAAMLTLARKYQLADILALQESSTVEVVARVSFEDKDKAKTSGFYWKPESKEWAKPMKEHLYKPEDYDFTTSVRPMVAGYPR